MSTDMTVAGAPQTGLSLAPEQTAFTAMQVQALQHLGVEDAGPGDLAVFFHVVQRTGLDPFARQIYMIGRKSQGKVKQTIQTGIDGFRLIGRRAADAHRETIAVSAPEWAHQDGTWRPVWIGAWGHPVAARLTIRRNGEPFTAVALFDEYKQTKFDGNLTSMWAQRPAGQIAKCAEALAWRMAFPQDLAGIYVEDEMQQADNPPPTAATTSRVTTAEILGEPPVAATGTSTAPQHQYEPDTTTTENWDAPPAEQLRTEAQSKRLWVLLKQNGFGDDDRDRVLQWLTELLGRPVDSTKTLTKAEASRAMDALAPEPPTDGAA